MIDRKLTCLALGAALLLPIAASAASGGVLIAPGQLPAASRASLAKAIERARAQQPRPFAQLTAIRALLPRAAKGQRGRVVTLVRPLRALKGAGLMPMLAELAFDATPRGGLSARAWQGWRISLLEAVGSLRDRRAAPVLKAIALASDHGDPLVLRTAVAAYGRLASDAAARDLIKLARSTTGNKRLAVLGGVGDCRRAIVAGELRRMLSAATDAQTIRVLIGALGQVSNSWAWKTPAVARAGESDKTRRLASDALIGRFARLDASLRVAATKAILLADHPSAPARIAAVRKAANGEAATALDRLAARVARNPLRR